MMILSAFLGLFLLNTPTANAHGFDDDILGPKKEIIATLKYKNYHIEMLDLLSKQMEVLGVNFKQNEIDLHLSLEQFKELQLSGANITAPGYKNAPMAPDQEYKNPAEIEAILRDINGRYPELTQLVSLGKSLEGRDIFALKIAADNGQDIVRPTVLFNGMHHAREVMTPEVVLDIAEYLTSNYQSNDRVKHWLETKTIWVLPMFNVDGNNKVWSGSAMWRKNTRGGFGVDINRNYPFKWGSCNGSSNSTFAQDYRGPSAASEPETQVMMNFISKIRPVVNISFHSYSELVLYPFGCSGQKTPTHEVIANIGQEMGKLINYKAGTPWEILYAVDGGDVDWMYDQYQVIPYVLEVNSSNEGFQPKYSLWRDKTVTLVRKAWSHLLDRLDGPGIRGKLADAKKSTFKNYTIVVEKMVGGRAVLFQNYKVNPDGTFNIILNSGEFKFSLQSEGRGLQTKNLTIGNKVELVDFNL